MSAAPSPCLIVGLGNPGTEYEHTRHNYGFMALDELCRELGPDRASGARDPYILYRHRGGGGLPPLFLAKPLTYMNKSGECVRSLADYYRIEPDRILVLHDELDLPLGRMKLKTGGGHAGHNGIRSIQQHLGTPEFARLRLGIGKPAGYDGASFVLSRFSAAERNVLAETLPAAVRTVLIYLREGLIHAQRFSNGFHAPGVVSPIEPPAPASTR